MLFFLQLARWNSERLSNLFRVTQQIRGWAVCLTLEPVALVVMTSFCTSGRASGGGEGEVTARGLPGGPCGVWSLNLWTQASSLDLCGRGLNSAESCRELPPKSTWEAPKERESEGKGKGESLAVRSLPFRQCLGELADILLQAGHSGVNKETKGSTGRRQGSLDNLLCAAPSLLNSWDSRSLPNLASLSLRVLES